MLRGWLAEDREGLQLHRRLAEAAGGWEASGREATDLCRGARLVQATEWAGHHSPELSLVERAFLAASQHEGDRAASDAEAQRHRELETARQLAETERARAAEQQRSNVQLRRRSLFLAGALVVALATSSLAVVLWRRAQRAAEAARQDEALAFSRELSASSAASLGLDDELAVLLALEAVDAARAARVAVPVEAEVALHRAIQAMPLDASIAAEGQAALSADGSLLLVRSEDGSLLAWDQAALGGGGRAGEPAAAPLYTLQVGAGVFELSPDGRLMAVGDAAGGISLHDVVTGLKQRDLRGHAGRVTALRFSGNGSRLVSVGNDATVRTWDTTTGDELVPLYKPGSEPSLIDISPDGTRVLAGVIDGGVYLWDPAAGRRVMYVIGQEGWPWAMAFCGSSGRFVIGSGTSVRLWDAASSLHLLSVSIADRRPSALACSPDGLRFATAAMPTTRIWDVETGQPRRTLEAGNDVVRLGFSSDAARLLVHHASGTVDLWDIQGSRELATLGTPRGSSDVAFSPDGALLAAAGGDTGDLLVWQVSPLGGDAAGAWQLLHRIEGQGHMAIRLAFDPVGGRLATGGLDETVSLWELPAAVARAGATAAAITLSLLAQTTTPGADEVADLAFDRDGMRLALASGARLQVWDIPSGASATAALGVPPTVLLAGTVPTALAWSPDGTQLAASLANGQVRVLDPLDHAPFIEPAGHVGSALHVAYSPDGALVATAGADGTARLWDAHSPVEPGAPAHRRVRYTLRGHTSAVNAVAFSPDGLLLATGGADGAVQLWEVRSGLLRMTLAKLPAPVTAISFSPDGRLVATSGDAVRIFLLRLDDLVPLARQRVSRRLTGDECRQYLHAEAGACGERAE